MPSPFPGMDPYLEEPTQWPDVHFRVISALTRQLTPHISPHFYVRVQQRIAIVDHHAQERRSAYPDLYLAEVGVAPPQTTATSAIIAAPTLITAFAEPEPPDRYIEIYDARTRSVVTTIEVLSPANKLTGPKRAAFLEKREAVMASPAHWIEIDLLRAGERPQDVVGLSDYYSLLKRAQRSAYFEVWFSNIRDVLPTIAVPLRDPFPDVPLDLQAALDNAYAEARYDDELRYESAPPPPLLLPADRAWAEARIVAWRQERGA